MKRILSIVLFFISLQSIGQYIPVKQITGLNGYVFDSRSMIDIRTYPGVSVQWTIGTITSGSPTLTVASAKDFAIGQWITVEGAGASGVNLRTTITNVVGTTITLNNNAGTSVTNKRVRHDCTPGIQQALIDAVAANKLLWGLADTATYPISGPLITSVDGINPNCQLYIPLVEMSYKMVTTGIIGSMPPNMASEGIGSAPRNTQGFILESTLTTEASGTLPAVLGTSYDTTLSNGNKNYINTVLENLIVRTATKNPAGTDIAGTMGAVNFEFMTQKYWNNVKADISSNLIDRVYPVNPTFGLISPESLNKAELDNGKIFTEGYYYGWVPGEHEHTFHYIGGGNVHDVEITDAGHYISIDKYTGELNAVNFALAGTANVGISHYETEHYNSGLPFPFEADIKQISGTSTIDIWKASVTISGIGGVHPFTVSGDPTYTVGYGHGKTEYAARVFAYDSTGGGGGGGTLAAAYISAVQAAGGTLDATAQTGLADFEDALDAAGITSKIAQLFLFAGNDNDAVVIDFMGVTNGILAGSPSAASDGLPINGSSQYVNSNRAAADGVLSANSMGLTIKYKTNSASSGGRTSGTYEVASPDFHLSIIQNLDGTSSYFIGGDVLNPAEYVTIANGSMVYNQPMTVSRTSSTLITAYQNGSSLGTGTGTNTASLGNTRPMYVGARNGDGTAQHFVNNTLQFYAVHGGLDGTEVAAFHTAINNLMTALGR